MILFLQRGPNLIKPDCGVVYHKAYGWKQHSIINRYSSWSRISDSGLIPPYEQINVVVICSMLNILRSSLAIFRNKKKNSSLSRKKKKKKLVPLQLNLQFVRTRKYWDFLLAFCETFLLITFSVSLPSFVITEISLKCSLSREFWDKSPGGRAERETDHFLTNRWGDSGIGKCWGI